MSFHDEISAKNYDTFRDCLASAILPRLTNPPAKPGRRPRRQRRTKPAASPSVASSDPAAADRDEGAAASDDLAEFVDYIAHETFCSLPPTLQKVTYHIWTDGNMADDYPLPLTGQWTADNLLPTLDPSVESSLSTYGIAAPDQTAAEFFAPVLTSYLAAIATAPPPPRSTKVDAEGCEICGRDWINLSYHHLIPRMVHDKVVRRGWHKKEDLENVAWLCGACHRFVHSFANHEDLARNYYTVERLLAEEKVRQWAGWVGKLRWKKR
ncbi:hypothetical protein jhhlp_005730 [Lomentospora prolificans]|uniref:HNH domain-containing protein n=1 Tax=Lomentospora prolificans TaxID=41688 RepID=A0A2N3N3X2_9PEZI|nr:hypothetical protein jhhlp_005730 [Lomentospora prolificans]